MILPQDKYVGLGTKVATEGLSLLIALACMADTTLLSRLLTSSAVTGQRGLRSVDAGRRVGDYWREISHE